MSDLVSICLVLQKQESDTMLDFSHNVTSEEHCFVNLEILVLLSSVTKMIVLKSCQ